MKFLDEIIDLIDISICEDLWESSYSKTICDWYDDKIDEYRNTIDTSHKWISNYAVELSELYDIKNLRIKHTWNLGYFIEVWKNTSLDEIWDFIHKQSLSNAKRYSTQKLIEFENTIYEAEANLSYREQEIFKQIRFQISWYATPLWELSQKVSYIDFLANGAYISQKRSYCTPEISSKYSLNIVHGKHPIISDSEKDFVSNDLQFSQSERVHIITWPNMWWKSTFLRQNALIIILAHIWYDIPASSAQIGLVDKIFSRVWAWDNIFLGQSTFMVEMQEMSFILRSATKNSFIIIDEIWRGTSTLDGMSLAWAILEYIHNTLKAKCIFATHYHELIDHSETLKAAKNFSVAVGENTSSIVFLRKVIPWGIKKSYGIEVAKIAGIHADILSSARSLLRELESNNLEAQQLDLLNVNQIEKDDISIELIEKIQNIKLDNLTPLDAMNILNEFKQLVKNTK